MHQMSARRWPVERVPEPMRNSDRSGRIVTSSAVVVPNADIFGLMTLLSSREHEIAVLVARGLSNKEVAIQLAISPWTVSAHLRRIFTKLDIKRRIELCLLMAQV